MRIVYTITNRTYSAVRGILVLLLGLALLIWPATMLNFIVKIIAAFLIAMGIVTLYFSIKESKEGKESGERDIFRTFASLNVAIYLLFGVLIFVFPAFFVSILVFLFGAILLVLGITQLVNLYLSSRYTPLSGLLYIVPIVITICGIILFFQPFTAKNILTMFFGGCLFVYGVEEIVSSWMLRDVQFGHNGKYIVKSDQ